MKYPPIYLFGMEYKNQLFCILVKYKLNQFKSSLNNYIIQTQFLLNKTKNDFKIVLFQ